MIWIILALGLAAVIVEGYDDRFGEDKRGKIRDSVYLIAAASSISLLAYWVASIQPVRTIVLVLSVRILAFDYVCNWFLKRYHKDFKNINVFTYIGKTALTDRILSNVNPWVRLGLRIFLFSCALFLFLLL